VSAIIGIDTGLKGAIAILDGEEITLHSMPIYAAKRGNEIDTAALCEILRPYAGTAKAALEVASAPRMRPGQQRPAGEDAGAVSGRGALKIGVTWGTIRGVLVALGIAVEYVRPQLWKPRVGVHGSDKAESKARACELYPQIAADLTKRRADFAESLLIATYLKRALA
jgi:hypothetical protein